MKALLNRFGLSCYGDPMDSMTKLRQTSYVETIKPTLSFCPIDLEGYRKITNLAAF